MRTSSDINGTIDVSITKATDDILIYANTAKDGSGTDLVPLVDSDGHLQVDVLSSGALTVQATNLDIRDLTNATDSVAIYGSDDGGTTKRIIKTDAGGAIQVDLEVASVTLKNSAGDTITGISGTYDTIDVSLTNGTNRVTVDASGYLTTNINGSVAVTGTFWQTTQPVSIASVPSHDVTQGTATNLKTQAECYQGGSAVAVDNPLYVNPFAITTIGHGVQTVTTAGTDVALAASTACKRVTIQAQTDNTGLIAVGATGVDATEATGTGIILYAGDSFELEIDNLEDVYIDSTVNGEGVRFTYFN